MDRKDWTRSAWVENDWMHQGARRWQAGGGQAGKGGCPGWRQGPRRQGVKASRRAGDWVMMALLVIVWLGVATAPLWMK